MKRIQYIMLVFLGVSLAACQSGTPPKPAHFRALSIIQYASAKITLRGEGKNKQVHQTMSLGYGKPVRYKQFAPGRYKITLRVKGKEILKGTYVLGKNGYYTLLTVGLLPEKWKVNPTTTMYRLKHIFAGEELESTNKYLPQWFMMRDNYSGSLKSAYIRFVNANPHTPKITIKKDSKSLLNGISYPAASDMVKLKSGNHQFSFLYGKVQLAKKRIATKAGFIYTAVVAGSKGDKLTVRILKNPSRTLLNTK